MEKINLISAILGASISLSVNEIVKYVKDKHKHHKKRIILKNYLSKVLKPGLDRYRQDLDAAIQEIESYPPFTNMKKKYSYDLLPWFNSKIISSQDINELYELVENGDLHADVIMISGVIDYLKDNAPYKTVSDFHDKCRQHYIEKDISGFKFIEHAKHCRTINEMKSISLDNLRSKLPTLDAGKKCIDTSIANLLKLEKKNWYFFSKVNNEDPYL